MKYQSLSLPSCGVRNPPVTNVGVPGTVGNMISSPAAERMPRTSVSTLSPLLYSFGPKEVEGTSGLNVIF